MPKVDLDPALRAALGGGPERHHTKSVEQGKLPVRERVSQLVDEGSFVEDALLANWDKEGLGADDPADEERHGDRADGTRLRMRISGDTNMDALLKLAARHTVTSLDLEHPSLEEIFLAYYGHRSKEVGR